MVVGLIAGLAAQGDWQTVQMFLHSTSFGVTDPQFGKDVSFYTFELPFYRLLLDWVMVGVAISFVAALITHYLFGGIRLAGRSGQISSAARAHLASLAGVFVLLKRSPTSSTATSCCSPTATSSSTAPPTPTSTR